MEFLKTGHRLLDGCTGYLLARSRRESWTGVRMDSMTRTGLGSILLPGGTDLGFPGLNQIGSLAILWWYFPLQDYTLQLMNFTLRVWTYHTSPLSSAPGELP